MWEKGISAFVGMGHSSDQLSEYLQLARKHGFSRLFTSLHIPEANAEALVSDFHGFVQEASKLGYKVTADISHQAFAQLGCMPDAISPLAKLGVSAVRLDYGFTAKDMAQLTNSCLEVELNASTFTPSVLRSLLEANADLSKMRACHNYYPRPETGLSFPLFAERCRLLQEHGIKTFAFIPSQRCPRGPIYAGLPTLEGHRYVPPELAAKELIASRLLDGILFGDPFAAESELQAIAALEPDCLVFQVATEPGITETERVILFSGIHTNRIDPGAYAIRSLEARSLCHGAIPPRSPAPRTVGAVTVDNQDYLRYMGEMQVLVSPLPPDPRVNIAAHIIPEELFLLSYLRPGDRFRLKEAVKS